ncbi:MAG TPA: hypothetical protein VNS56_08340 [Methylomirabilota bacterium]|nr:hypothetical protein [Methylomirabilota bacterium]
MAANTIELALPATEHALAAELGAPWRDLLYVPGPDFTSSLEPGLFKSALVVVPAEGPAIRVSSIVMPAFGIELCPCSSRRCRTIVPTCSALSSNQSAEGGSS